MEPTLSDSKAVASFRRYLFPLPVETSAGLMLDGVPWSEWESTAAVCELLKECVGSIQRMERIDDGCPIYGNCCQATMTICEVEDLLRDDRIDCPDKLRVLTVLRRARRDVMISLNQWEAGNFTAVRQAWGYLTNADRSGAIDHLIVSMFKPGFRIGWGVVT